MWPQRKLAIDGAGIAYLPLDLVDQDLAGGRLVAMFSDWIMPTMPSHAVEPLRRFVPAAGISRYRGRSLWRD